VWCCSNAGRGCPVSTTTSCHYDCQVGLSNFEAGWSHFKKEWCCKHQNLGCPPTTAPPTTTTSLPFDCNAGYNNWLAAWSAPKKAWCCSNAGRGCPVTTTTLHYDCQAGLNNNQAGWSIPKKEWCCTQKGIACLTTTSTTSLPFDCTAGFSNWMDAWSIPKKAWCCSHTGRGCPSTTTSCHYDCQVGLSNFVAGWSHYKKQWCCKHQNLGCPVTTTFTTTYDCSIGIQSQQQPQWPTDKTSWCCQQKGLGCPTTVTTTTTVALPKDVLTCGLTCFGAGARPVRLPGSTGAGAGASLNDVSQDECRRACVATPGCEAVMFTNRTKGVPFKTMCYGKRDVHTSKCQPGSWNSYVTEIIGSRPWGKCAIFGDPHIIGFDRVYGPPVTNTDPGEFYLIKSEQLNVHGRFGYTHRFPTASSAVGIALGGPMIKDHTLVVEYVGPQSGYKGFKVFWDGKQILGSYPSTYLSADGVLNATHDAMNPTNFHREGRHTIGGTGGLLPSYLFHFGQDLNVYVLVGPDNCNAVIETRKMAGPQDGYCGNFNCEKEDDSLEQLKARGMAQPMPAAESLFKYGRPAPKWVMTKVDRPSLKDCDPVIRAQAVEECKGLPNGEDEACIFDACATNKTEVATEDAGLLALPFDCSVGEPTSWEEKQKTWCCQHEHRGCPGDAAAPTNATGCDTHCSYSGKIATCKARVYWASTHQFLNEKDACVSGHKLVLSQCPSCGNCTLHDAGCKAPKLVFFKRFAQEENRHAVLGDEAAGRSSAAGLLAAGLGVAGFLAATALVVGRGARAWSTTAASLRPSSPTQRAAEASHLLESQDMHAVE